MNEPTTSASPVTVVLCTRDRPERLAGALHAVRDGMRPADELIVVDSASKTSQTVDIARAAGARTIRSSQPGLSRARNAGLAAARHDIVAYTDDDCEPRPGWTAAIATAFDADERIGFVTGRVEAGGSGGVPVAVSGSKDLTARRLDSSTPIDEIGHGANHAVRASPARALGSYDPLLGAGGPLRAAEDKDMLRRLLADGWIGAFVPDAVVVHDAWRSRTEAVRLAFGYGLGFGAMTAKVRRDDRTEGRALLRRALVTCGVGQAWRDLRHGYELGVAVSLAKTAGSGVGAWRGRKLPMHAGNFVDPLAGYDVSEV